ncbi:shikimate dehydrogenase [Desulfoluna sp.]|uniref:shikimate dehydrogenase n=1 Tax=Desulfoluna sp. TaxID=2045199 RepID=UPI002631436E|nr:shikimate dehydrogenase [Desulfoluna sp.]
MAIDAKTRLFGVFGDPVAHSLSPAMHNAAFGACRLNAVYLAFGLKDAQGAVQAMRTLGMGGASVTIPHKTDVMAYLDEVDLTAREIGAVNTLVNREGKLIGFNSDVAGAMRALEEKGTIAGKKVLMIGAGGAARAIGYGIRQRGGSLLITNRSEDKGNALAEDLGAAFSPLSDVDLGTVDILINATSVGMVPRTDAVPLSLDGLTSRTLVMDIVYNPLETALLSAARAKGCVTVDGTAMFVYQAVSQFELWTGLEAPVDLMRRTVLEALGRY